MADRRRDLIDAVIAAARNRGGTHEETRTRLLDVLADVRIARVRGRRVWLCHPDYPDLILEASEVGRAPAHA